MFFHQEEELKSKGESKYEHLSDDLHVLIEVEAPPGQAHARLGIAIEEIKKYLNPVSYIKLLLHCVTVCFYVGERN